MKIITHYWIIGIGLMALVVIAWKENKTEQFGVGGKIQANFIPKFASSTSFENSVIYQEAGKITIGTSREPEEILELYSASDDVALDIERSGVAELHVGIVGIDTPFAVLQTNANILSSEQVHRDGLSASQTLHGENLALK